MTEADVVSGAGFSVTARRPRASINAAGSELGANYDVASDGRVLFGETVGGEGKLVVVTNWLSEARRKIREAKK